MRTGNINGTLFGDEWQSISDYEVPALDSYTKLLIHGDSIGDATGKTVTAGGSVAVTTAQYNFSSLGRSIVFNGSTDYLSLADSADWNFGTGDFTIDLWVRFNSLPSGNNYVLYGQDDGTTNNYMFLYLNDSAGVKTIYWSVKAGGSVVDAFTTNALTISTGVWYHIALVRYGNDWAIYWNGIKYSPTHTASVTMPDIAATVKIGRSDTFAWYFNGWMSEVRVSKGIARWTADFEVPSDVYGGARTYFVKPGLDGDNEKEYRIIFRGINGYNGASGVGIYLNNDSATNYGYQRLYGNSTTTGASRSTSIGYITLASYNNLSEISMGDHFIYAKTGFIRTCISYHLFESSGTSVGQLHHYGQVWNNTSSNLTSIVFFGANVNAIGVGTRIIIMRRSYVSLQTIGRTGDINVYGRATGCWQLAYSASIGAAVQTHTISSLDGDRDSLYLLRIRFISNSASPTYTLTLNGDSGTNYGHQYIYGNSGAISANRQTGLTAWYIGTALSSQYFWCYSETLIFAKSGYARTSLNEQARNMTYDVCNQYLSLGSIWSNTASNITSMTIAADQASGIGGSTYIELFAYRP